MVVERSVVNRLNYYESMSEVIMRTWVKNNVRIIIPGPRFPKNIYILVGYTVPKKRNVNSVMGKK